MIPKSIPVVLFDFLICGVWIMLTVTGSTVDIEDTIETNFEIPYLTPRTHTEPFSQDSFTSSPSKYVTPENTDVEVYDQILPSRDPTTPLSRIHIYRMISKNQGHESASTLATTIHAPPPIL
ncbi:uncharacterized protein TNCV_835861 [Trichonephila clavipes]|nr:uncharacterized protein TNCV_835861 [Trichonephila clavipes]